MKKVSVLLAALLCAALVGVVFAGDKGEAVTLEGKVVCAKCTLKEDGRTECQDVLQVKKSDEGGIVNYYIVKNDVAKEFGHPCEFTKYVKITGSISEKDGAMWIAASNIEEVKES